MTRSSEEEENNASQPPVKPLKQYVVVRDKVEGEGHAVEYADSLGKARKAAKKLSADTGHKWRVYSPMK